MDLSQFAFRLIVLFFPGLVGFWLIDNFTFYSVKNMWKHLLNAFLLGALCYATYYPLTLIDSLALDFNFLSNLTNTKTELHIAEIGIVTVIGLLWGALLSIAINRKWTSGLEVLLGGSGHDQDEDVWTILMNSGEVMDWVLVKDLDHDMAYHGWVDRASEKGDSKELVLKEVTVGKISTGEELYSRDKIYLSRPRNSLNLEFLSKP